MMVDPVNTHVKQKKTKKFQMLELVNGAQVVVALGITFCGEIRTMPEHETSHEKVGECGHDNTELLEYY